METELANETWMDDCEDCGNMGSWTEYRSYTNLIGKITKAFSRAMKYLYFSNTPEVMRCTYILALVANYKTAKPYVIQGLNIFIP